LPKGNSNERKTSRKTRVGKFCGLRTREGKSSKKKNATSVDHRSKMKFNKIGKIMFGVILSNTKWIFQGRNPVPGTGEKKSSLTPETRGKSPPLPVPLLLFPPPLHFKLMEVEVEVLGSGGVANGFPEGCIVG